MNDTQLKQDKTAWEVFSEVEIATAGLEDLPRILQLAIDNYDLDAKDITQDQAYNMAIGRKSLFAAISTVQYRIWDIVEKLNNISLKKDLDQEDAETTK